MRQKIQFALCVFAAIGMCHSRSAKASVSSENVTSVETAELVKSYLDETIDPCDDFYQFACGNYIKWTWVPNSRNIVDVIEIVRNLVQKQLQTILNESSQPDEPKAFRLAKQFNAACMNSEEVRLRGIKPLESMLEELGGWPVAKGDAWSEDDFDWVETIKKFRQMGLDTDVIFALSIERDSKNSTKRILNVNKILKILLIQRKFQMIEFYCRFINPTSK